MLRNFSLSITWGVRILLALAVCGFLAKKLGEISGAFNLPQHLALIPTEFWKGAFWQILTHPFAIRSGTELLSGAIFLIMLGSRVEQTSSTRRFWEICFISILSAGLSKICFTPHSSLPFAGLTGIIFGLLAAWLQFFGHEQVSLFGIWSVNVRIMVIIGVTFFIVSSFVQLQQLSVDSFLPLVSGLAVWSYLAFQSRPKLGSSSAVKNSERIARLEL